VGDPESKVREVKELFQNPITLPSYQRDFAWDIDKMERLWKDLLEHLWTNSQKNKGNALRRYFVGSVVIDEQKTPDGDSSFRYVVDGQQRFTTITVMAAAVRDALISTGHIEEAQELDDALINNHKKMGSDVDKFRFRPLDVPPNHHLSSEAQLRGYRKRFLPIPLNIETAETPKGSGFLNVKGKKKNAKFSWSVAPNKPVRIKILMKESRILGLDFFVAPGEDGSGLIRAGISTPDSLALTEPLGIDISAGHEIVLAEESKWPETNIPEKFQLYIGNLTKKELNDMEQCDLFEEVKRDFYMGVRSEAEHYILGKKQFKTLNKVLVNSQKTIQLELDRNEKYGLIGSVQNHPPVESEQKPWKAEFFKTVPQAPKEIPDEEELKEIIEKQKQVKGHESVTLEVKNALRSNVEACYQHEATHKWIGLREYEKLKRADKVGWKFNPEDPRKCKRNSKYQIIRSVSALMNSFGGGVIAGVTDYGDIVGIEIDKFTKPNQTEFNADVAENWVAKIINSNLGIHASQLIEPRVIEVEGVEGRVVPVMYIHVKRWDKSNEDPPKCMLPKENKNDPDEYEFVYRYHSNTTGFKEEKEINEYLERNFRGAALPPREPEVVTREVTVEAFTSTIGKNARMTGAFNEHILPESTISIDYLDEGVSWADHLSEPDKRAEQIRLILQRIILSRILFNEEPAAAISHFMLTNNKKLMADLTSYDMAAAYTQRLVRPKPNKEKTDSQKRIESLWTDLSQSVYVDVDKDPKWVKKFFYYYLMASGKWKGVGQSTRWLETQAWEGLEKYIESLHTSDGKPDWSKLEDLYQEMKAFAEYFSAAMKPDKYDWPSADASLRNERTYLKILSSAKIVQHVPVYMAIVHACRNMKQETRGEITAGFLKNWIYVHLRYNLLAKLELSILTGFRPGKFHGKLQGKAGWITNLIHQNIGGKPSAEVTEEMMNIVKTIPLTLERDLELGAHHPWKKNDEHWPRLGVGMAKSAGLTTATKCIILAYERACFGDGNHSMSHIHGIESQYDLEHVLPQKPKEWGGDWHDGSVTEKHGKWVNALGNHILLEDSRNSHVGNKEFHKKVPKSGCGANCSNGNLHYEGSNFRSAQDIVDLYKSSKSPPSWNTKTMKNQSNRIMNTVVEFFTPTDTLEEEE